MFELSDERIRSDELELHYYGFSSTDIYVHYRTSIDKQLKVMMLEFSKFYNEMQTEDQDPEAVEQMLIEQYNAFWAAAEPTLNKFYEDIQNTLALPKDFVPKSLRSPQDVFYDPEVTKIEKEIQCLEEQYMSEKYYLHALEQRKEGIDKNCIPLKNQIDLASKLLKENMEKMKCFDVLDEKRVKNMETYLEGIDKKTLVECMWVGGKSEAKEKENMKDFMEIIAKNKRGE